MDELKRLRREAKADAERVARGELPAFRTGSGAEVHAGPEAKRQVDRDLADVLPVAVDNFLTQLEPWGHQPHRLSCC